MTQRTVNVYLTIRCTVDVSDDTSVDEIVSRVAECCDYSVEHEDDVCVITDTCLLDADSVASTI
tara:strand:+ start:675 stop:866 length:192 start_codon:yes stop_codon:yes gene_type:complete